MSWRPMLLVWLAACLSGCGLRHTVDRSLLSEIAMEYKLTLFDAENEVSIAMDERDHIVRQIQELKRDIAEAERQQEDASADGVRARRNNQAEKAALADQAAEVFGLKVDYLEARLDLLRTRLDVQSTFVDVARAKLELAKAQLVERNNVRGAESVNVAKFEQQVEDYVGRAKKAQEMLNRVQGEVDEVKATWLAAREKLNQASGGGWGSPWAEDGGVWGTE